MEKVTYTNYRSFDNKFFNDEKSCQEHEEYQRNLEKRLTDLHVMDSAALEKLTKDLSGARERAYDPNIIDTMGTVQCRAIFYMKGVCERFLNEHENIKMT